nr:spindle and kinetochore-associated protein 1 [Taeniopygia guttata]XP_030113369.3 spindle and kinetochore-associated protein 1 [Taeniopygia guttata]XP_041567050.1 spindle and kinetochore-associated protein 1 [Taeniopygia guttata]
MVNAMASSSLEDLCLYISLKISNIKKFILLRDLGKDDCLKHFLRKVYNEGILIHELLQAMEIQVKKQEELKKSLREIQKAAESAQREAWHLLQHVPRYLPKPLQVCNVESTVKHEEETKAVEPKCEKKPAKERAIKEVALITTEEFENVPAYMKGRITYDQINAVVEEINKAVVGKYKILYQPLRSMSAPVRNLYHRFIEEETKDTNGVFFIVEDDIKEFTKLKLDKRFYVMLSILRHCQRLREIRSSGLVRYGIC